MSHERINVNQARSLYDRLRTWPAVARAIRRRNGGKFQAQSIIRAVRTSDRQSPNSPALREGKDA